MRGTRTSGSEVRVGETDRSKGRRRAPARSLLRSPRRRDPLSNASRGGMGEIGHSQGTSSQFGMTPTSVARSIL